jgi:predicted AlkP superfamily phosphohydrolase/phosphomutase
MTAKVLVIGLDSGTWRLMRPWMAEGRLPEISSLVENGASGVLESVIPPVTGLAWPSFLTGKNPGGHGVFSFMKRRPGTYEMMPHSASDIRGDTLADILSQHGRRVALINVPMSYPPRPTNGVVVTGMYTPSTESDFTFPKELKDDLLKRFDYEIEYSRPVRAGHEREFIAQIVRIEEKRSRATRYLLEQDNWDLFSVVFRGTDVLSHYFWRAQDPSHPGYDARFAEKFGHVLRDHYQQMDTVIGRLRQAAGNDCTVVIMSDHGSGGLRRKVYLDNWLLEQGLMKIKRDPVSRTRHFLLGRGVTTANVMRVLRKSGLLRWTRRFIGRETRYKVSGQFFGSTAIDWANTQAYPVGVTGALNINLQGREPAGAVSPGAEYDEVVQYIQKTLLELRDPDTNEPMVSRVLRREEIYRGPFVDQAPDLVIVWQDYAYKATFLLGHSNKLMSPVLNGFYSGFHTMDGILLVNGPGVKQGLTIDDAEIIDVAPTILALLGLAIPRDMDGKVLRQLMVHEVKVQYELEREDHGTSKTNVFSSQDEQLLTERLENLGYL